ncbi:MAG: hypothetical protein ACJ8C4_06585 [Gemmataceae bacterium]
MSQIAFTQKAPLASHRRQPRYDKDSTSRMPSDDLQNRQSEFDQTGFIRLSELNDPAIDSTLNEVLKSRGSCSSAEVERLRDEIRLMHYFKGKVVACISTPQGRAVIAAADAEGGQQIPYAELFSTGYRAIDLFFPSDIFDPDSENDL